MGTDIMEASPCRPVLDKVLFFSVFALILLGLVSVTSSSMPTSVWQGQGSFYYFFKQGIFAILGLIGLVGLLSVPIAAYQSLFKVWLVAAIILLIMVLIPHIGHSVNGSKRWILLGPIALQVSEFVKLFGVMFVAQYMIQYRESVFEKPFGVLIPIAILGVFGLLLLLEPDFGATVVLFVTCFGMMFMAGVRARWFVLFVVLGAIIVPALVILSPYRMARFTGFLHPWDTAYTTGYQLTQSLIAVGHGGIFGVGLGNSVQKLFYLPEANTDFVLAIFAEELGLVGLLGLLALYVILVWRGLRIAYASQLLNRLFASYVAYGLTFWIALQVIVNVGVNIGLLPTKGLTLPFMSYGGSSLVVDTLVIGILLRIDLENQTGEVVKP
jgi:cell division protein FtsW